MPLGTVSGGLSGFAFENVGGTWTTLLGTNLVVGEERPDQRHGDDDLPQIEPRRPAPSTRSYTAFTSATDLYEARGGGAFFSTVLSGDDIVDIPGPASLGPLGKAR